MGLHELLIYLNFSTFPIISDDDMKRMVTDKKQNRRNGSNAGNDSHKFALKVLRRGEEGTNVFCYGQEILLWHFSIVDERLKTKVVNYLKQ